MRNVNLFSVAATAPPKWPKKLTTAACLRPLIAGLAFLLLLFAAPNYANAQGCNTAWPGTTSSSSPTNMGNPALTPNYSNSQAIGPGNFFYFTAQNGLSYEFLNCTSGNWDTDVLIYRNDNGGYLGGHDGVSSCGWRSNNTLWTNNSGFSGTVRVVIPRYFNCAGPSYGWSTGLTSTVMRVRQTAMPTPPVPSSNFAACGTVTLTRANPPTGYTYYWQTTAGGTSTGNSAATYAVNSSTTIYLRARSASGYWGPASSRSVTVNQIPSAASVNITSGSSGQCGGSITLTATGGSPGTMYWQNTTNNGTSTGTAATSRTVTSSGTYYFRARNATCWGPQGSRTVTINTVPAAVSVAGGGTQCGGSRTLTASGGGGGTIYWQGTNSSGTSTATPSTSQSVSSSGTYYFRSRNASGNCWGPAGSASVTINPVPGSISVAGGGTFCSNQLPVTITASGGSGGTIYFQGTNPSGTATNLGGASQSISSTGTYFFRSRSTAGCWGPAGNTTVTVNSAPAVVNVSASATTQCGGSVTLTATGGSGGTIYYQGTTSNGFSTSLGSTPQSVSSSGTYYFRSYSGNCWGPQGSVTVTINSVPAAVSVAGGGTYCTNGTRTLTASGGGGGTIYWQGTNSNGTSIATASSSQAVSSSGTYYFRSRSAQGCWGAQGSASVTINSVPAAVTVSGGGTGCNGQATLTASGGSGGTVYWQNTTSNGTSTATPSTSRNVTASGTYYFRSRNATGNCWGPQGSASVTIVAPIVLSTGAGTTQSTCGASNGIACVNATGGTGSYTYAWAGGGTGDCKSGLPSGTYQVTVSSGGCSSVTTVNVADAGSPTASINTQTNVSCFGGNNGIATVTVSGGSGTYNLNWSNGNSASGVGAGSYSTTTGLAQGPVSVTVVDGNGCNSSASTVITQPTQLTASVGSVTDVLCFGASTGAININVSGGTGTKTFVWSPGGFTTEDITGRPANTYSVVVTDGNGCTTTTGATITQPAAALSASSTFTNVSCFGGNNGAIDLSVSGGTGPYTYVWSNGATTQDLGSLAAGSYTVTITDASSCTATHTRAISQPASAVSISVDLVTNVDCFGGSTGSITVSGSGGTAGYQYALNAGSFGASGTFGSLAAGNYTLRVRDANLCETSTPVTVTQPSAALAATILSTTDANCFGSSSGAVDLGVNGGTTNYSYLWSNSATTQDLTNVPAGSYSVTVTDNNSCSTTASASVGQATVLSATASVTDVSACQGFNNGEVTFTGAGGTGSYSFSIDNGSTYQLSSTFTDLAAGTYNAWIRDNGVAGCDVQLANVVINQPTSLPAPTLPGGNTYNSCGLLIVNVTPQGGADRAVLYDGIPGGGGAVIDTNTAFILNTLTAGNYTFYATSYNSTTQCEGTDYVSFTVAVVNPILITANVTDVSCFGAMDGAVDISVTGGTGSYSYNWSNGPTSQDLLNVGGSSYNVVVTDGQGCFNIGSYRVVEFAPINASISVGTINGYAVRCHGDSSAQMTVNTTGGDGNYAYNWSDGSTQAARTDGYQGTFTVTVTDGQGCSVSKTTTLFQPPVLGLNLQTSYFCSGGGYSSATIQIIPSGGQAPYEYSKNSLSFRQSSNTFSNLADGSVDTFYIFDANNCVASAFNTVTLPPPGTALSSCDLIYVAPSSEGGDVNNAGTQDCPTTLAQAMNLVSSTRTYIRMLGGTTQYTYSSPVQLVNNVTVEGGYTRDIVSGEWVKNTSTPTIINFENAYANPAPGVGHYAGFISTGRNNWTVRDMTINVQLAGASGTQDGNGRSVYGILINGSSNNYTLSNVEINTGDASDGSNGITGDNGQNGLNGADGAPGQFIQDNTNGNGPFPACCGGGDGGTGGDGGGNGGDGSIDPGWSANGNTSACQPYGSPSVRGGGGGGSGGHGGSTNGLTLNIARTGARGGGGGRNGGPCNHNAIGAAVANNNSPGFIWSFYTQPQPAPAVGGVDGNNGANGDNASLSFTPGNTPNTATLGQYFIPGNGADGGSGFGGSGGSGGGGTGAVIVDGRNGTPSFLNVVRGSGGGAGGGGAEGGQGGDGGGGGGAAFGLYVASNSVGGASLTSVIVNSVGVAGNGGQGADGGNGGTGGFGGQGGPAMSDTQLNVVLTSPAGNGGVGGNGGSGGRGQDGDNGTAAPIYFGGNTPPVQTPASSNGTVTVSTVKACTNSVIPITKTSSDNWVITGGSFVNDITSSTSSFSASSDTASIFYTSVGSKNIGVGSTTYPGFINVVGTRPVPVITTAPFGTICEGDPIDLETTTTGVQYRWSLTNVDSPTVVLATAAGSSIPNLQMDDPGTFTIKLEVREECCGWSIPTYATLTVSPLPVTMPAINGPTTVCAGQSVTYSAPLTLHAAPNVNSTTGYKWQLPVGAVATSAGGLNGFINGGNINITVTLGNTSGDVTVTPSNACGDGSTTTLPVTVAPTPVITGISGNTNICSGTTEVLTPVVTGASGVTYLWSTGATTSSITVSPTVTTTYTVTVTAGSCSDVESKTINVTTTPATAGPITGLTSVFYGQPGVSYSIAPAANATSYTWTVPTGATIASGQGTTSIVVNFGTATSGNVSVTPVNGACSPAATTQFVTVAAAPLVWTGNTSNNWNIGSNWSTGNVPIATDNILIPSGRPAYPEVYTAAPVGNQLVIESGASVTLDPAFDMDLGGTVYVLAGGNLTFLSVANLSATLRVAGNFELDGSLIAGSGTVLFDGATPQTISGTGTFNNLEINNNAGVSIVSGMVSVRGGVNLDAGVLTTNDRLTIKSDAQGTGWVDNFSPGMNGSISGDIIMQRFFPAAAVSTAFHYISSAVNNGAVSQLSELGLYGPDGGQIIPQTTCDPTAISGFSPYGALFEWRENAAFLYNCKQSGWFVRSSGNLTNGRGYAGVIQRTADFTLDMKGTANTGTVSYNSLANTNPTGEGWHLVSNPYPSPIEWNAPAGFIGAAHFWQSSGSYTGTYQPQLSGTGHQIASMQGFLIEVSGSGPANFVLNQSDRRTGDPAFQRQASWYDHILNVQLSGNSYADKTTIYFAADPTDNWDDMYDAQKRESNTNQPTLYTRIANYPDMVGINGLPNNNSSVVSVPMGMKVGTAGTYTFTFEDISTFDASTLIYLEDLKTGTIQNLRANDVYTFTSTLSDDTERFVIHFYPPAAIATVDGNCEGLDGAINVDLGVFNVGGSVLTWDSYELTDANGAVVSTNTNVNGNISVTSLPAGNYNLNLSIQGYQTSEVITIGAPAPVDASYNTGFSTAYTQAILEFVNQSVNATDFAWTFGDGTTSNLENPTHIYNAPGQYDVTLVASSGACSDTYSTKVEVLEVSVGLPSDIENPMVTITSYQDVITIGFLNLKDPAVQVDIFDLTGRKIIETLTLETGQAKHQIKMSYIPSGYYFVRVNGTNTYSDKKVFLSSDN